MQRFLVFYRTLLLNLLFVGYLVFLHPLLLQRVQATDDFRFADPFLGGLLLSLQLFELAGVYLKHPASVYYFHHYPARGPAQGSTLQQLGVAGFVLAVVLHLALSSLLALLAAHLLGVPMGDDAGFLPGLALVTLVFVVIAKEAVFIVAWYNPFAGTAVSLQQRPPGDAITTLAPLTLGGPLVVPERLTLGAMLRDLLGDLLLLVFSAVGYTVLWDAVIPPVTVGWGPGAVLEAYFGPLVYFLVLYPLLRSIYLFQDLFLEKDLRAKVGSWLGFALVLVTALLSVPRR